MADEMHSALTVGTLSLVYSVWSLHSLALGWRRLGTSRIFDAHRTNGCWDHLQADILDPTHTTSPCQETHRQASLQIHDACFFLLFYAFNLVKDFYSHVLQRDCARPSPHHKIWTHEVGLKPRFYWIRVLPGSWGEYYWTPHHVLESHWFLGGCNRNHETHETRVRFSAVTHLLASLNLPVSSLAMAVIDSLAVHKPEQLQVQLRSNLLQSKTGRLSNPNTSYRVVRVLQGTG